MHVALIMSEGGVVDAAGLRLRSDSSDGQDELTTLDATLQRLLRSERPHVYETVERQLVTTAFQYCERNQVQTARRLGVSRNIVRAQLKRFGLLGAELPDLLDGDETEA